MKKRIQEHLEGFTVAEIIAALGCPPPTAYQWKDGRRSPPEWQHPHWLAILNASKAAAKSKARKPRKNKPGDDSKP